MRRKPYPITRLTGGLDVSVDAIFLADVASPNLRNVRFDKGMIRKGLGWHQLGSGLPLDGPIMFIDMFPMYDGSIHYLISTLDYLYRYNTASGTYEKKNDGSPLTGDEDNRFSSAVVVDSSGDDLFLVTNGKDPIKKWDGGVGDFANLGGWSAASITGKSLAYHSSRLIVGGTIESGSACPKRVRWSVVGDVEDCTGTGSGFVDLIETPDWVVAIKVLKGKLYVIKERSIWELVYVGGTQVYRPELRIDGVGSYSPNAIINLGDELGLFGSDNVYTYDGIDLDPKGHNIYPFLYETENKLINSSKIDRVPGAFIEELNLYAMCFPTQGDVPDLYAEYYFDQKAWVLRDRSVTAFGFFTVQGGLRWVDLTGNWLAQSWHWSDKLLQSGAPTTLMGDANGYVYEDDRTDKSSDLMRVETKDWIFGHAERIVDFRIQARGGPFNCYYSLDGGEEWSSVKSFGASSGWEERSWPLNLTSQKFRVKIETYAEDLDIIWWEPWYIERARSKSIVTS